jgi:hypothetical protein
MRTVKEVGRNYLADIDIPTPTTEIEFSTVSTSTNISPTETIGLITILCNATSGNITVSLPTAVASEAAFNIKKIDSSTNTVIIDPSGAETIDGEATVTIYDDDDFVQVQSDGTNWVITNLKLNLKW